MLVLCWMGGKYLRVGILIKNLLGSGNRQQTFLGLKINLPYVIMEANLELSAMQTVKLDELLWPL